MSGWQRSLVHPEWAPLALVCAALVALLVLASWWRARRRAQRLLGDPGVVGARRLARDLALLVGLAAITAAALGPRLGQRIERVSASGADVVLLLDVSRSMDAADVAPSRLVRARQLAIELLARLEPGDRAALAAFAGRGVLLTPLTPDHDALAELTGALDGELLGDRASDLGAGTGAALAAFEEASRRPRVIVVLSDGEDPAGGGTAGAAALARAGVRLVAIALGSDEGAAVPEAGDGASGGGQLHDALGRPVVSRRDAARLAQWAAASDGASFVADRWGAIDPAQAIAAIRRDAVDAGETVARRVPAVRTGLFAAFAFALLWLEWTGLPDGLGRRRGRPALPLRRGAAAAAGAALALLVSGAAPGATDAPPESDPDAVLRLEAALRKQPADPALLFELGVARAEQGDGPGAARALRAAALTARDPALAALAWFDLGVLALEERALADARDAFFEALALVPEDPEARFNLEWTLRALAKDPPPAGQGQEGGEEPEPPPDETTPPGAADRGGDESTTPSAPPEQSVQAATRFAPSLTEREVERWLDEVQDSAGAALRAAAEAGSERRQQRRQAVAW
ncbi:MAG: VWA domain-containing protein [Deltaproteobacteria bacterium]|nr:VWA domain-containing protein [Deltaproteobacteria bacterium]